MYSTWNVNPFLSDSRVIRTHGSTESREVSRGTWEGTRGNGQRRWREIRRDVVGSQLLLVKGNPGKASVSAGGVCVLTVPTSHSASSFNSHVDMGQRPAECQGRTFKSCWLEGPPRTSKWTLVAGVGARAETSRGGNPSSLCPRLDP